MNIDESQGRFVGCFVPGDVLKVLSDANYQDIYQFQQHFKVNEDSTKKKDEDAVNDLMELLWEMVKNQEENQMWEFQIHRNM